MDDPTSSLPPRRAMLYVSVLAVLIALNLMDRQLLSIVAEPIKHEFDLSDTQLGLLTGAVFAVVFTLASIPIAWAADRFNRVAIVSVCATIWAVCTGAMGLVNGFQQLVFARIGLAVGEAGCNPCAQSLIADYVPAERRGRALALYSMGVPAGFIVAGIAGGLLNDMFGWRVMFFVLGAVSLAAALVGALILHEPGRTSQTVQAAAATGAGPSLGGFRALSRKRAFRNLLIATAFGAIASFGALVWGTVFVVRYFGWTPGQAGAVFGTLGALVGFFGTWLGGRLSDGLMTRDVRWPLWLPAAAMAAVAPFGLAGAFATFISILFVTASAEAFLRTVSLAPIAATLQRLAPNDARARAAASVGVVANLVGLGLGPTMVGVISDSTAPVFGADALRYGVAALAVPQALAAYFLWRAARTLANDLAE